MNKPADMTAARIVDNPLVTDAVGEARPDFLKITVTEKVATRIGGLANISPWNRRHGADSKGKRLPHHERAAERFLNLYEARYGRVAPAIDLGKVRVDTSIVGHDGEMVHAVDATADIQELWYGRVVAGRRVSNPPLDILDYNRIVTVVCLGGNCAGYYAVVNPNSPRISGRKLEAEVDLLLTALDKVSEYWGLASRNAA